MKKFLALFLALIMALSLVACGDKGGDKVNDKGVVEGSNVSASGQTDKDVYVDMWGIYADDNYRTEWLLKKADEFEAAYEAETGISVEIEYYSQNDYGGCATKLAAGVSGGALPVLCQISSQQCPAFEPLCDDVKKYMSAEGVDAYLDGLLVGCQKGDKLFAVPGGRSTSCYIVNMDLVEQAGYTKADVETWDWDKFHEIMLAISKLGDDIEGCGLWWDTDAWMWESALYANGGSVDNEDATDILFDEDGNGAQFLDLAAEMMDDGSMYSIYDNYAPSEIGNALNTKFVEGTLGCRMASITNYGGIKKLAAEAGKEMNIYMAIQPAGDGGFSVVTGGNNFLFLKQSTETQKKVAAAYLEYIAQPENDLEWNGLSSYMAVNENTYETDAFKKMLEEDPNYAQIGVIANNAHARPNSLNWAEMRKYMMDGLVAWSQDYASYKAANGGTTQAVVEMWADHCQKILDENAQ